MYKFIIYIFVLFTSLLCEMYGQTNDSIAKTTENKPYVLKIGYSDQDEKVEVFQKKINSISNQLDKSIKENKESLKRDLSLLDQQYKNNEISSNKLDSLKKEKAIFYASKIDEATSKSSNEINLAIQKKVNNELDLKASLNDYIKRLVEKRSYVIMSIGFGTNLLLLDGKIKSDIYKTKLLSSINFSIGGKTRLVKDNPHYYLRYELTSLINYVKPANEKVLDVVNNQTVLIDYEKPLKKSRVDFAESRISTYFEYDFSKKRDDEYGNVILRSRQSYFVGIGGFAGFGNNKIAQILKFESENKVHKNRETGNFGANKFVYGIGAYVGHKKLSLFSTYNLNKVFKKSEFNQHFLNFGIILDII